MPLPSGHPRCAPSSTSWTRCATSTASTRSTPACSRSATTASCRPPRTPRIEILKQSGIELAGKHAVVVGRSNVVGKPAALLLLRENATVTICHSKTVDLPAIVRAADIVVVAIGRASFVTGDMLKPGAVVVDVGINVVDGKLVGDVDFESARRVASAITPVPGGVGPLTNAILLTHLVRAARDQADRPGPARARAPSPSPRRRPADVVPVRPRDRPLRQRPARSPTSPTSWASTTTRSSCTAPRKAKVTIEGIERLERERPRGKYVLVTAISPTPLGEGKSTTTVGLAQGLERIGKKAAVALRQPSPRPGVRDQGRRRRRRLQPGHPDGGLQPPPDRRHPRHRRRAQPRRGVHRQPHPPRQRAGHRRQQRPLAARPRHQRPRPARRRGGPGRPGQRLPAPDASS